MDRTNWKSVIKCYNCGTIVRSLADHYYLKQCSIYSQKKIKCEDCGELVQNMAYHRREKRCGNIDNIFPQKRDIFCYTCENYVENLAEHLKTCSESQTGNFRTRIKCYNCGDMVYDIKLHKTNHCTKNPGSYFPHIPT